MAAFASFHVGEKLKFWEWKKKGIKSFAEACRKKNRTFEDDVQVIRILNNRIFLELGILHLAFSQLDYNVFKNQLIESNKHTIVLSAFEKLNRARIESNPEIAEKLIWEANIDILHHEQYYVVQPMFNKLTTSFSSALSLIASFDYRVNHKRTNWVFASKFFSFMMVKGFSVTKNNYFIPSITNYDQRWFWITEDLVKKWRKLERDEHFIHDEIDYLSKL